MLVAGWIAVASCSGSRQVPPAAEAPSSVQRASPTEASPPRPVQIQMRNVRLHFDDNVAVDVRMLRGEMISLNGRPPVFDDSRSYSIRVASAELAIDMKSLSALLNRHVFAYDGSPLSDISVAALPDGRLEQKALLHKGVPMPVAMTMTVATTPDGKLRLHVDAVKTAHVPTTGLMHLLGLHVGSLVHLQPSRGVSIDGDDIIMEAGAALPPPSIRGRVTQVQVRDGRLLQTMGPEPGRALAVLTPPQPQANYVYFFGSDIQFGKLTMHDADLQLVDADPSDPFDFYPARYRSQLMAGYSKNLANGGLETFMPDFNDLKK